MDTQTYTNPDLLLRILRYPLVSMLVLYFSLYYVNAIRRYFHGDDR